MVVLEGFQLKSREEKLDFFIDDEIKKNLKDLKKQNLYRSLREPRGMDFSSNDYFSLTLNSTQRESLIKALKEGLPLGAGSSRLLRGHTSYHKNIETQLRNFLGREAVLLFSSGYLANVGALSLLCKKALIFSDEFNHASLIDGMRLSGGNICIYPHKDMSYLKKKLEKEKHHRKKVIVTESLFSMEGDLAPLKTLLELAKIHSALLYVDEAHATGVFGEKGEGRLFSYLPEDSLDFVLSLHTFGKAFGSQGACLACSKRFKEYLVNHCRPFIFTTAPSPVLIPLWEEALRWIQNRKEERESLKDKASFFRDEVKKMGFSSPSESPIVPLILGGNERALYWAEELQKRGFDVRAIRYPSVPKGTERLRICIHSRHREEDLHSLLEALRDLKESSRREKKGEEKK